MPNHRPQDPTLPNSLPLTLEQLVNTPHLASNKLIKFLLQQPGLNLHFEHSKTKEYPHDIGTLKQWM